MKFRAFLDKHEKSRHEEAGDFTTTWRVIPISFLAIFIGAVASGVADRQYV